ncbi:MAG TPA: dTDP-4-dehydrorhamnose 3,5-epimerase [Vicinamibacterales bacterium]|jgi:dTDP-4-dehydrorhamnose 3,5-epimerase|nr:dTDP-4-dehydrorhamnose 3,5-epimerase [Vicinamibacterales bacterium]
MQFLETPIAGVLLVEPRLIGDGRGFFARLSCERELGERGLTGRFVQWNNSFSAVAGTIRGLHYQMAPHQEAKLVRCIRGSIFDVVVDVRPSSPTFGAWFGAVLTAANRHQLFAAEGLAHGYQTLEPDSEVIYGASAFYHPEAERGVRWNDQAIGIAWPFEGEPAVSDKDRRWPDLTVEQPA